MENGIFRLRELEYEIFDERWNQIKNLFPVAKNGRSPIDNRLMFNAILWIARTMSST